MKADILYVSKISFIDPKEFSGFAIGLQIWNPRKEKFSDDKVPVGFHDTVHPHMIEGKLTEAEDGTVTLVRGDETFIFKPCTLEDYRREYYKLAMGGEKIAKTCQTDEELWAYYRKRLEEDFY